MAEHPWEPMEGETAKAFEAFEYYRRLPPGERSLQRAWEHYWDRPGNARARHQQEAGKPHGHWTRWMSRWRWRERALAWDEEVAALARDQELERELKAKLQEQEEEIRQRRLMREEARAARAVGRRILARILQGVEAGQLEQMQVSDLLPHLQKASVLLEVGQKLDRLFSGEPTDITRQQTDTRETVRKLVDIMQEFCPPERWQELAEKINGIEADR
jgi:hypothetical protein